MTGAGFDGTHPQPKPRPQTCLYAPSIARNIHAVFLVNLHALRQQIGGRFVVGAVGRGENRSRRANHRFLSFHQLPDHFLSRRHAVGLGIDDNFANSR